MQTETSTIGKGEEKRFVPSGWCSTVLHTMTEGKAKTMTALHEHILTLRFLKLKSRDGVDVVRSIKLA